MVDWHPSRLAQPVEWMLQHPVSPRPFAVIRLIRFPAQKGTVDAWYRIVTWAQKSPDRELVGWCLSLDTASEAAWDYFRALSSWQHAQAASRMHERPGGAPPKPPAHDLLLAYRAAARDAAARNVAVGGAARDAAARGVARPLRDTAGADASRGMRGAVNGLPDADLPGVTVSAEPQPGDRRTVTPSGRSLRDPSHGGQPQRVLTSSIVGSRGR